VVLYYCLTNLTTISLSLAQRANGYHLLFFVRPEQKADKRKKKCCCGGGSSALPVRERNTCFPFSSFFSFFFVSAVISIPRVFAPQRTT
jgi:hypothetical protein